MRYDGSAWVAVGSAGFTTGGGVAYTSLAFSPNGTPYLAYAEASSYKATVMQYNGSAWVVVGSAGFSAGTSFYTSLVFSPDGTPYLAYSDGGNGGKSTVMRYNGSAWAAVGSAGFSAGQVYYNSLAFSSDGTPYLAYQDVGNSNKATVMQYNGSAWVPVGGVAGFSSDTAANTSLVFSPNDAPYLAYSDGSSSDKATVMQYNGSAWVAVGNAGFSASGAFDTSLAFSSDGTAYLAYQDVAKSSKATVMRFADLPEPTATTVAASGITSSSAILNGNVNDSGLATTVTFQYGTTTSYGTSVAATTGGSIAAGTGSTPVAVSLNGLSGTTTYHFRVVATAGTTVVNGSDLTFTTDKATPTVTTWPTASPITYGQTLVSSALSGGVGSVAGTFTWSDSGIMPSVGTTSYSVTFTPTDTADYNTISNTVSVTVNATVNNAPPTVTVSSPGIAYGTSMATLTASIAYIGSTAPSGAVTFTVNGTTYSGSCTVTSSTRTCMATAATSNLAAGNFPVAVSEAADSNYVATSGSGTLTVTVAASDFSFKNSGATYQTVIPGNSTSYTFALSPLNVTYPGPASFTLNGLPAGASYTISPQSVEAAGAAQTVTLTILTTKPLAANTTHTTPWSHGPELAMAFMLLPLCFRRRMLTGIASRLAIVMLLVASLGALAGLTGCGSRNGFLEQASKNYAVTVTATSGGIQHSATVTLNVQ
jgi:hypothetical protein